MGSAGRPSPVSAARDLWAGTAGIHGSWPATFATERVTDYLAGFVDRSPVNVLPQAPGAAIRYAAKGWDTGPATVGELGRMRQILIEWFDAGATGLAVGLDYEPGAQATEAELTALCEVVAERGGSLAAHMRYEDLGRPAGYDELGRIGAATGVRINIAHERLDRDGAAALERIARHADVAIESYLYGPSSTQLTICLPATFRAGGPAALARRLDDPTTRDEIAAALGARLEADRAVGDRVVFAASADPARVGSEIADVAAAAGQDVGSFAAECLIDDPGALFIYHHDGRPDQDAVFERTIAHPATMVASDGIYVAGRMHPRGYGTFPRVLRRFVRETGVLSLAEAIHAMTGRTAGRYRVPDRGAVAIGGIADLVVFDPETISDGATWAAPRQAPDGILHVLVNGRPVVADGRLTGDRPGRVLAA